MVSDIRATSLKLAVRNDRLEAVRKSGERSAPPSERREDQHDDAQFPAEQARSIS